jgi:signal transduction histidine kinase
MAATTFSELAAELKAEAIAAWDAVKAEAVSIEHTIVPVIEADIATVLSQFSGLAVQTVLNFAKAPSALHSRWSLAEIIADTLVLVRPKLAQAKIHVMYEPSSVPYIVEANKGQLQQVLLNLILNATQAMPDGGAIAVSVAPGPDGHVTLDLADTGTGIPDSVKGRIFDSFFSGRPDGTGLGLAIAKRILQAHHGDIALISTGPGGTTMRVTLPLAP